MTNEEEAKMAQETQGKTTNNIINQQQNTQKLLRIMTGALSVLSYPPYVHFMSMLKLDFSLNVDLFAMCTGVMTGNP
jgi:hypothetical protein